MKILVGHFSTESNANIASKNEISDYKIAFDDECIKKLGFCDVFEKAGFEVIPSIYASGGPSGVIKERTFRYIESCFIEAIKNHLHEIDGICMFLHGASEVENIGSGEHYLIKEIREIVGPYLPIAISCDPHGNLTKEYVEEGCTLIRDFRESPHTDIVETKRQVAQMLVDLLNKRQNIHPVYRKLPLILGGEQSVSADEPVASINKYMDELEIDPRILSVSWHVGYIRHDTSCAGAGIVVIPTSEKDQEYAEQIADKLAEYVWNKHHEFHYTGLTKQPDEALDMALSFEGKPVFITDSGDNVTSGSTGYNTFILRQVLAIDKLDKKFLFANLRDEKAFELLQKQKVGDCVTLPLGVNIDEMSVSVSLTVKIKHFGDLLGTWMDDPKMKVGKSILVSVEGKSIDINITQIRHNLCQESQFIGAGINWDDYDVIVVKEGYIFPELKKKGKCSIMSLTDGATPQDTSSLKFKLIQRPMFPIDSI